MNHMMNKFIFLLFTIVINTDLSASSDSINETRNSSVIPFIKLDQKSVINVPLNKTENLQYLPFIMLANNGSDSSEFWLMSEILHLVQASDEDIDYEKCERDSTNPRPVRLPSRRTVRPICRSKIDFQLCPQCPHFSNQTECELFRDSCRERRVDPLEYRSYCDNKYGRWRTMFVPADYSQCRCCDECVFYRELDQSCIQDEFDFDMDESLPVTTIDFRAGCNPYLGHPEQELKALRCDKILRRCVPVSVPSLHHRTIHNTRQSYRYQPVDDVTDCPATCRGYHCTSGTVTEDQCVAGAFLPDNQQCNCCGRCSVYQQLNEKCAEFKKTIHNNNGSEEVEIEEEFLEPGCDDGLVCRFGKCRDIHSLEIVSRRAKRSQSMENDWVYEPCKREMKLFKKKYGPQGHLHFEAPQCTPLWLYAPVQCRRFVCYCALEDGTRIHGVQVPRVEVSNMNCDCARERCRSGARLACDGYGNYREAMFRQLEDDYVPAAAPGLSDGTCTAVPASCVPELDCVCITTAQKIYE